MAQSLVSIVAGPSSPMGTSVSHILRKRIPVTPKLGSPPRHPAPVPAQDRLLGPHPAGSHLFGSPSRMTLGLSPRPFPITMVLPGESGLHRTPSYQARLKEARHARVPRSVQIVKDRSTTSTICNLVPVTYSTLQVISAFQSQAHARLALTISPT